MWAFAVSKKWSLSYIEFFYDGWHHVLSIGPFQVEMYTWNRLFHRWRRSSDPACNT